MELKLPFEASQDYMYRPSSRMYPQLEFSSLLSSFTNKIYSAGILVVGFTID